MRTSVSNRALELFSNIASSTLRLPRFPPSRHPDRFTTTTLARYSTLPSNDSSHGPEPVYSKVLTGYQLYRHPTPFKLDYGHSLAQFELAYEVWGNLSPRRDNAILLHTGLSASSHAKSHPSNPIPGWWEKFIGPGSSYPIDTDRYFVICTNVLGSCYGSTGPNSLNPITRKRYATDFPILSIHDMLRAQFKLLDHLRVDRLYASIGSSMGGMQSIAAAWLEPDRVHKVISISGCARSSPSSIAIRYAQRSVLMSDPNWNRGHYYESSPPHLGMKLARQIATITYRSGPEWEQRFGRRRRSTTDQRLRAHSTPPSFEPDFLIETYLDHQAEQFCAKYDANSFLYVSKAMDLFDMTVEGLDELSQYRTGNHTIDNPTFSTQPDRELRQQVSTLSSTYSHEIVNSLKQTFQKFRSTQQFLIVGVQTDVLFPIHLQRELAEAIRLSSVSNSSVTYFELYSPFGHDTFLIDLNGVGGAIRGFLS